VVLEGSDATALHHDTTYITQLFGYLKSDSTFNTKPVLIICDGATACVPSTPAGTVQISVAAFSALSQADLNSNYSAVYVSSPGTCCGERVLSATDQAKIAAFVALGGSVAIQGYQGGSATLLGFDAPQTEIGGFGGGAGGPSCWDTEIFLPTALAKGFTQPGVLGCWGHQAYDMDYFGALGFTSLVDSGREFDALGSGVWSSFLALGGELGGGGGSVSEPSTLLLVGMTLLGLAATRRRKV
jgi:PEP-CTERM motif